MFLCFSNAAFRAATDLDATCLDSSSRVSALGPGQELPNSMKVRVGGSCQAGTSPAEGTEWALREGL